MDLHIEAVVETAIYVDDLARTEEFYGGLLGLEVIVREAGRQVFFRVGNGVLLAFLAENTLKGDVLPAHGARGPGHFALGIPTEEREAWHRRLLEAGIAIEHELTWPLGGKSLYFRDPSGNLVELITRGVWGTPAGW
jgi:catechol 2,3-dioxygenase-like lactoylglutathione lyase family enzyme